MPSALRPRRASHQTASGFVIAGLLDADDAAYPGARTPQVRPMERGQRHAAANQHAGRKEEGGCGEERPRRERWRHGEEAH